MISYRAGCAKSIASPIFFSAKRKFILHFNHNGQDCCAKVSGDSLIDKGDKVYFEAFLDKFTGNEYLYGTRENDDQMTYELDEKDLTYTLKTEEGQKLKIKP